MKIDSLVQELQSDVIDSNIKVTELLRKALIVANKLNIIDFEKWIKSELYGYKDIIIPEYRKVTGNIKAYNRYKGLIPVKIPDEEISEDLSQKYISQPISEIEDLTYEKKDNPIIIHFPPRTELVLREIFNADYEYILSIPKNQIISILDAVRNIILEWSLMLEKKGIMGEGLTFSSDEKQKASSITFNIEKFIGVLGNVESDKFQIGEINAIISKIKNLGVSEEETKELENIFSDLEDTDESNKKSILERFNEWLNRNSNTIGSFSKTIAKLIESYISN